MSVSGRIVDGDFEYPKPGDSAEKLLAKVRAVYGAFAQECAIDLSFDELLERIDNDLVTGVTDVYDVWSNASPFAGYSGPYEHYLSSFKEFYFLYKIVKKHEANDELEKWRFVMNSLNDECRHFCRNVEDNFERVKLIYGGEDPAVAGGKARAAHYRQLKNYVKDLLSKRRPTRGWKSRPEAAKTLAKDLLEHHRKLRQAAGKTTEGRDGKTVFKSFETDPEGTLLNWLRSDKSLTESFKLRKSIKRKQT